MADALMAATVFRDLSLVVRQTGYTPSPDDRIALERAHQQTDPISSLGFTAGLFGSAYLVRPWWQSTRSWAARTAHMLVCATCSAMAGSMCRYYTLPKALDTLLQSDTRVSTEAAYLLRAKFPSEPYTRSIDVESRKAPRILENPPSFASSGVPAPERAPARGGAYAESRRQPDSDAADEALAAGLPEMMRAQARRQQQQQRHTPPSAAPQTVAAKHTWTDDFPPEIPVTTDEWGPHDDDLMAGMGDEAVKDGAQPRRRRAPPQDAEGLLRTDRRFHSEATFSADRPPQSERSLRPERPFRADNWDAPAPPTDTTVYRDREFQPYTPQDAGSEAPRPRRAHQWLPPPSRGGPEEGGVAPRRRRGYGWAEDGEPVDAAEGSAADEEPTSRSEQRMFKMATAQSQSDHVWDDLS